MLLLVTIGLVLVGAVSLVIGFVSNTLGWIYLSIVCSLVAAGVLVVFSRMSRQHATAVAAEGGAPAGATEEATAATAPLADEAPTQAISMAGDGAFPIPDYDSLRVNQIIPLLGGLSVDDLDRVREREQAGKARATILGRIDTLQADKAAEPEPAPVLAEATGGGAGGIDDLIADYDSLSESEILPLLAELDDDELEDVADYEEAHKNRIAIIDRVDDILDEREAAAAAPAKKSGAKKAGAKKAGAKKAAATKKAPAKKVAGTAKRAPAGTTKKAAGGAAKATKKAAGGGAKTAARAKKAAPAKKATAAKKAAKAARKG